jgi:hypothetical protein
LSWLRKCLIVASATPRFPRCVAKLFQCRSRALPVAKYSSVTSSSYLCNEIDSRLS